jgi:AraC-like DNA-binding protein
MWSLYTAAVTDVLADVLEATRTGGTVFARATLGAPWALRCDPVDLAAFHVMARGSCTIRFDHGADPVVLATGDVALLPHGHGHTLYDDPAVAAMPLADLLAQVPAGEVGDVAAGGPGVPTTLVCGGFVFQHDGPHPLLGQLPVVVHLPAETASLELRATLDLLVREVAARRPGSARVVNQLADVLLVYLLRHWIDQQPVPAGQVGWLRAVRDPTLAAALSLVHGQVGRPWTLRTLAAQVGVSASALKQRFRALTGEPLGAYITRLRLDTAARLLKETEAPVARIAGEVGYRSEYAFNRAFARSRGQSPGRYRRAIRRQTPAERLGVDQHPTPRI